MAKNLLAGVTIFADKPFIIGDWIKASTCEGTVVDITFRSTRIKNWDNLEVVVPNAVLINDSIINYNRLKKRRIDINFCINLNTPSETIEMLIERIKIILENTENVVTGSVYVTWNEISEKGLNIFIYLYTKKVTYDELMKEKTKLQLLVLEILEKENIKLAYPGIHIDKDEGEENGR